MKRRDFFKTIPAIGAVALFPNVLFSEKDKVLYWFQKITVSMPEEDAIRLLNLNYKRHLEELKRRFGKGYKYEVLECFVGYDRDDFPRGLKTVRVKIIQKTK